MQLVADKYYIWYNRILTVCSALVAILTICAWTIKPLTVLRTDWGFTPLLVVIGIIHVIYGTIIFKRQANLWAAAFISVMIFSVMSIGMVHNAGQLHSWYMALWFIQVFAGGMFGLFSAVGCDFMITLYYFLIATGPLQTRLIDPIAIGMVLATYILSALSYWFWRHYFINTENVQLTQLAGQLKSKQQQAEILIQSISDGVILTDTEGKIALINPAAANFTGWSVQEAVGIDVTLVAKFAQEDGKEIANDQLPFKQVEKTNKPLESILQLIDRTGQNHHIVSVAINPIILPKSTETSGMVAVIRDVSNARAEEHRRADFISTASHEMRTPVAAIEGYLALALNDKVSKIDAKARGFLVKAHESTQHLGKLFQDLLTSAKAEDGRLVNHPVVVEMGEYLQQITEGLRFAAEKKGLLMDFTIGMSQKTDANVSGGKVVKPLYYSHIDPDRMREVITNLFDNAVKYSDNGKISIALTGNDNVIQFYIRDTGHGIPADDIPHLFQKFYRVDNSSTRTIGGTGLGLFICRKIVELYNGRIWVESEIGKGSTFYINLPRLSSQKATELQAQETQNPTI